MLIFGSVLFLREALEAGDRLEPVREISLQCIQFWTSLKSDVTLSCLAMLPVGQLGGEKISATARIQTTRGQAKLVLVYQNSVGLVDQLAVCAAGMEAQKMFDAPTHEGAGWGDYGKMVELLEDLVDDEQSAMMHKGHARAFELVLQHRAKVERLAIAVFERKRLGAEELSRLLEK
ncbi:MULTISPECIES: hypothetical protein [unclassified Bradyrhizobium]|uniref:hypothetical protein n=1 Tax=unclassified Bradyrhizobium TaxID=2631580 RepID=UPI0029170395|nr:MULTISPECIES: hypothetical protein [unclassified Bradyrhizobium]